MAVTKTPNVRQHGVPNNLAGRELREFGVLAFDDEYATGGEAVTFSNFREIAFMLIAPRGGYVFEWTGTKVKVYKSSSSGNVMVEMTSSGDLSALSDVQYLAIGF